MASIEVEKAIFSADPNGAEVAVVGLPHPRCTEAPTDTIISEALPRTSTRKIQKYDLRPVHESHYVPGVSTP
ncbi:MAG: hypothetical protein HIU81_09880 [Acidobacteria bacterium]|nr:hypothetical protein [Acidobacteriota bacterium]